MRCLTRSRFGGYTWCIVAGILDRAFGAITAAAMRGDEVALSGFGKFKVTERSERQGRNPATGEAIIIPAAKS